jgi:hypothetical protein
MDASDYVSVAEELSNEQWSQATLALFSFSVELVEAHADEADEAARFDRQLDKLRRYLPLFIEIANAQSSGDVAAALDAAFPAGGYKLKYRQPAVSVNAMLGAYGGGLYGYDLSADGNASPGLSNGEFALYAPIGVHLTKPVGHSRAKPWHLGMMIAVIDVGGLTTSKWVKETTLSFDEADGGTTEVTLGEPANFNIAGLVAPGGYFTIGVASSPFIIGFGASYSPFAHQLTTTAYDSAGDQVDTDSQYLGALRFGAFVAVDITLVGFGLRAR